MSLVSKKARYALHGLAYLATFSDGRRVPFEGILSYLQAYSGRLTLSPGYIAKIFQQASRAGLTRSATGPSGGYWLARPADEIRLFDVIEAFDGRVVSACCLLSTGGCDRQATCGVREIIHEAELCFWSFFEHETLATMAVRMDFPDPVPSRRQRQSAAGISH